MTPPDAPQPADDDLVDKGRLASYSDNVISIASTLLVLDVRVPADLGHITVLGVTRLMAPRLLGFVLSFAIVGVYWVGHHVMVRQMREVPRSALWANNLFLLCISLVPASAALLGSYPGQRASAVLYGVNLVLVGASLVLLWHTAVRFHRRFGYPMSPKAVRLGYTRPVLGAVIAVAGIALASVHPWASYAVYCLTPGAFIFIQLLPTAATHKAEAAGGR